MNRESRGIITAQNPDSSASGKWQILDSTWGKYGGYLHAKDAPEWVQDAKARSMALCNWQPPNYCA
jgi:muramidase (phage lysozyme)